MIRPVVIANIAWSLRDRGKTDSLSGIIKVHDKEAPTRTDA